MSRSGWQFALAAGSMAMAVSVSAQESRIPLPLGKEWAAGQSLPRPVGVGATYYYQQQDYNLTRVTVGGAGVMSALGARGAGAAGAGGLVRIPDAMLTDIEAENSVHEIDVKVDAWILPFLNVFGLVGSLEGETEVDRLPPPIPPGSLTFEYDGVVYGAGATLAGGIGRVFGSLTATYTDTSLDGSESSLTAWILAPRVGVRLDDMAEKLDLSLWVGAFYQGVEEQQDGRIDLPGVGPVEFEVEFEQQEEWNYTAGACAILDDRWQVELEAGAGNRTHAAASVTYRF